jgi:hypothetical protein
LWETEQVSTEEQVAQGRQKVAEGDFTGIFALVRASAWGRIPKIKANYAVDEKKLSNSLLGLPEGNLNETTKSVIT